MALRDIFRSSNDPLAEFDENEATDLSLHIRQCGRRYKAQNNKLDMITGLILVLCMLYALSNIATIKAGLGL
jgi:hypothetical protein